MCIHCFKCGYDFLKWEFWIGTRYDTDYKMTKEALFVVHHLWICIVPMLSFHCSWQILEDDEKAMKI